MYDLADTIISQDPVDPELGARIGTSREGRPVRAFRLGSGPVRVSLLAGCHADEPVGPRLLSRLVTFLGGLEPGHPLMDSYEWWIVPHINPDGVERNRLWQAEAVNDAAREGVEAAQLVRHGAEAYDPVRYFTHVVRELPGDDLEFGFPRDGGDAEARPEARAVYEWWQSAGEPFRMHVTLHGMAFAAGPWFLLEPAWLGRCDHLMECCREATSRLGYRLHDVERQGEKGFHRIGPGFCTRPDSTSMREHFLRLGDEESAARFRPSSMEAIRSLGGDPLTLVSEMPLFITPGVGETLGPPDPAAERWKERRARWQLALSGRASAKVPTSGASPTRGSQTEVAERVDARTAAPADPDGIARELRESGLAPMKVADQMRLQWRLISAGLEQVRIDSQRSAT